MSMDILKWGLIMGLILSGLVIIPDPGITGEQTIIKDSQGYKTTVEMPVERIISLGGSVTELLIALGAGELIVGIDSESDYLQKVGDIPSVGNRRTPNIEQVLRLKPDLIIADTHLTFETRSKIEAFGIPVIAEQTSDPEKLTGVVERLGSIVGKEDEAKELNDFMNKYRTLIAKRLEDIDEDNRPKVYWEFSTGELRTAGPESAAHQIITEAGGYNIGESTEGSITNISREYLWIANPDVIIKMASRNLDWEDMQSLYEEINKREIFKQTAAVEDQRVYVLSWRIHTGISTFISSLYYAKWFYPERFEDIAPNEIYREMAETFFGLSEVEKPVYP